MEMRYPEYAPDALFQCGQNKAHGQFRRDRLPTYRGALYCPRCGRAQFSDLKFVGRESDTEESLREQRLAAFRRLMDSASGL